MKTKKRILIIDDEEDCCLLMSHFFQRKNYEVFIAHTLLEGIALLNNHEPDIVFLDNNLPDGLGWLYATQITGQFPNTKVHLISAYNNDYIELAPMEDFSIWEKPISMSKLEDFLNNGQKTEAA
jgi:DNA-binding NtrC family response regulator